MLGDCFAEAWGADTVESRVAAYRVAEFVNVVYSALTRKR